LKQSNVHGEQALEVVCHQPRKFKELRDLGRINEQIQWKQRFFVPRDEAKGIPLLMKVLERYPALADESVAESAVLPFEGHDVQVIDLADWIVPVESDAGETTILESNVSTSSYVPDSISTGGDGVALSVLFEQYSGAARPGRRKPRVVVEEQGQLFALQ
jgi:hypothetical protein